MRNYFYQSKLKFIVQLSFITLCKSATFTGFAVYLSFTYRSLIVHFIGKGHHT